MSIEPPSSNSPTPADDGGPAAGSPLAGEPLTGEPLTGEPLTGEPLTGALLTGAPLAGPVDRPPLSVGRLWRMCRKELRETLRDRRTIVTLVLMPLLAYPLLAVAFQRLLFTAGQPGSELQVVLGVDNMDDARLLERYLAFGNALLQEDAAADASSSGETEAKEFRTQFMLAEDLRQAVAESGIDVGIQIRQRDDLPEISGLGQPIEVDLLLRAESPLSRQGADFLEKRLRRVNRRYVDDLLTAANLPSHPPADLSKSFVELDANNFSLTTFVPLILILMTITGAVYPAIDLTAGERERGTLETLMAAPVPRFGLLFAKYVAVVTVAMLTASANLIAMSVTLMATGMGALVFGPEGPTLALIDLVFVLLVLFAAFFSAILLALTSFARSFKEAQSYLIPLMLVTLAPGVMSLMPDLQLDGVLAIAPLVNIVLLARDLLEGGADPVMATAAVLSTMFYAVAALAVAARIFGTDAILYGSQATWTDLFRRPSKPAEAPTVSGAMFCLAVIYPVYFLLGNSLYRLPNASMATRLMMSAAVTMILFLGLPIVAAILQNTRIKTTFQLHGTPPISWIAAVLFGFCMWPWAHEIFLLNDWLGLKSLGADQIEAVERLLDSWQTLSPAIILFAMALTPAVCEEFFFRGYLMGALRRAVPGSIAILVSSLLFGVFHVITTSALATERFLPSTALGFVLGWVCWRTKSVLPGMVMHAIHNGFLLMVAYYRDELAARGWGVEEQSHMPPLWLGAATIGLFIAVAIIVFATRRRPS